MKVRLLLAVLLLAVLLPGCGGGGGNNNPPPPGVKLTRFSTNVNWPARSRDITALSSTLSLVIILKNASETGTDVLWTINRGATLTAFSQHYISAVTCRVGTWDVLVRSYTLADGKGVLIAETPGTASIAEDGSGFPSFSLSSKVAKVTLATNRSVPVGQKRDLPYTVTDNTGNVIVVSAGSITWNVLAGADKISFASGQAEGLANGTASVSATIDGVTSDPVLVVVGTSNGTLTVNVKDPTGTLVPKSTVTLYQSGFQVKQTQAPTGTITFTSIAQGPTEVRISSPGFHDMKANATVVDTPTPVVDVPVTPAGSVVATNAETRLVGVSGAVATFETDIAVTDETGAVVTGIDPATFTIDPLASGDSTYHFAQVSAGLVDPTPRGNFTAFLAVDATQSMPQSDPAGSRIEGLKAFYQGLPNGSNAAFGYFPSASNAATMKTWPDIGFVGTGAYFPYIDGLRTLTSLNGTPVYNATIEAVNTTAAVNSNPEKTVVVLTDGHQTLSSATLAQAVAAGQSKGIRVFTVRLGTPADNEGLPELAQRTGGGTVLATDPLQLYSLYKALPAMLRGRIKVYRVRWTVTRDAGNYTNSVALAGTVKVPQASGALIVPFFLPVQP